MSSNAKKQAATAVVAVVLLGAAAFAMFRAGGGPEPGSRSYFYDLSEERLYVAPSGTLTPHEGIGGESGDGVQAFVITCGECSESEREIVYLSKMSTELRARHEERERLIAAGEPADHVLPDRMWINDNQLLKRPGDADWVAKSSQEGQRIVRLLKKKCEDGEYARVCGPDD